jgi:hypothetical protein
MTRRHVVVAVVLILFALALAPGASAPPSGGYRLGYRLMYTWLER